MSLFRRTIDIDINPGPETELILVTTLQDMFHDIRLTLIVDREDYRIIKAAVDMERIPHDNCHMVKEKVASLAGVRVGPGFTKEVLSRFKGAQGCPNMANLMFVTAPLAMNAAAVLRQQQEKLSQEQLDELWYDLMSGVCIAYSQGSGESETG